MRAELAALKQQLATAQASEMQLLSILAACQRHGCYDDDAGEAAWNEAGATLRAAGFWQEGDVWMAPA